MTGSFHEFLKEHANSGETMAVDLCKLPQPAKDFSDQLLRHTLGSEWHVACYKAFQAEWQGEPLDFELDRDDDSEGDD